MQTKTLELRDRATFIAVIAIKMHPENPDERFLLRRSGYPCDGQTLVLFTRLDGGARKAPYDPYDWGDRTMQVGHDYVTKNFDALNDGDVVDVEYILGETTVKKTSERY